MKSVLISAVLFLGGIFPLAVQAQNMVVGDKAPELKVKEWLYGAPKPGGVMFIEFFHSSSKPCLARLAPIGEMANKYKGKLNVVVISHESAANVDEVVGQGEHPYFVAIDEEGKTFAAYGVQYVPFGVLVDARGRIVWFGNPGSLSAQVLDKVVK